MTNETGFPKIINFPAGRWPFFFFPAAFLLLLFFALRATGVYDTGDGVMHYLIARSSWKHPELFLDDWGKPLYTLLSSPFAQFGYAGSVVFNSLCLLASGAFAWKTAETFRIPYAPLAALLTVFAPIALPAGLSGLTEPLFSLVLTAGIYFAAKGKNTTAAWLISFLPFARTEGFFLAPLFGLLFLLQKDFRSILLLCAGTFIYTFAGWFHYHDLLWIIHRNPYKGAETLYGHGSLFHFISLNQFIWGAVLSGLIVLGSVSPGFAKKTGMHFHRAEIIIVYGCFFLFLALHSVFWWKGLFGSLGLHRVMACTVPAAVLIGMRGLQALFVFIKKRGMQLLLIVVIVFFQLNDTFGQHPQPFRPGAFENTMETAAAWMKQNGEADHRVFCAYPYMAMALDKDYYDPVQFQQLWSFEKRTDLRSGDIIIWESHFCPYDMQLPLGTLENDARLAEKARFGKMPESKEKQFSLAMVVFEVK